MIIRGDFGALASETGRLDDVIDRIDGRLVAARRDVDDFLVAGWTGPAASRFRTAFERWLEAAAAGSTELRELVEAVRGATNDLAMTEQANVEASLSVAPAVSDAFSRLMGAR